MKASIPEPTPREPDFGRRVRIGVVGVDRLDFATAVREILALADLGHGGTVFTPNVDHIVRAEDDIPFKDAYSGASLSLVDGMPLVWASHLLRTPLPAKISGSDWFEPLLSECSRRDRSVYFLGGRDGAAAMASERLQARYSGLEVVGIGPSTRDIKANPSLLDGVVLDLRRTRPDFVVVALGSPLQEIWAARVRKAVAPAVLLGLGSVLDLASGMTSRAPEWLSRYGLEWLYRLSREPRRLWRRYLLGGPRFCLIVGRQLFGRFG